MMCQFQVYDSDFLIHTPTYLLFFRFFSIIGYYKIVNVVSSPIQAILVVHFIYSSVYLVNSS